MSDDLGEAEAALREEHGDSAFDAAVEMVADEIRDGIGVLDQEYGEDDARDPLAERRREIARRIIIGIGVAGLFGTAVYKARHSRKTD